MFWLSTEDYYRNQSLWNVLRTHSADCSTLFKERNLISIFFPQPRTQHQAESAGWIHFSISVRHHSSAEFLMHLPRLLLKQTSTTMSRRDNAVSEMMTGNSRVRLAPGRVSTEGRQTSPDVPFILLKHFVRALEKNERYFKNQQVPE